MCLIVFAWRPEHTEPLILAANRDEFYARPSAPLDTWKDQPHIIGGRDLTAGGTWLAVGSDGRFATVTNIRDPGQPLSDRSRGELPVRFLESGISAEEYAHDVARRSDEYTGFNLLLGDRQSLWHLNARSRKPHRLPPGIYGVSNADLNTPWPKLLRVRAGLERALDHPSDEALFTLLADTWQPDPATLPHTGVNPELEALLSSVFIASENYGTRASTLLRQQADGRTLITERRFGTYGKPLGESSRTI
ncbi:NRDE family protein [Pseudomonas asuensis]|uniref:NRDE family protein n=1 Tax=Pseudomonas asuensis TaxID=1825787 RepID=A0ABQ2GIG9_9PSED|nr:NRDE family protein [Pseudomonas asuensis]GGL98180.1 hypothetical protein GCM10009425_06550 [Pseudomonas asuensis]